MKPQVITLGPGLHNADPARSHGRILSGSTYKNASTICIIPTRGMIPCKVVQSWLSLMTPMNHPFFRIFVQGMEVGGAYSSAIEQVLATPELAKFEYVLTLEEDNMPPSDGLLKLIESINTDKKLGAVGGLYWTKGEQGQPMIYGNPTEMPKTFAPQVPIADTIQRCNGLGMGFTLFRLKMLKDRELPKPLFQTKQEIIPGKGGCCFTQDLWFFENAGRIGWQFACDTRVRVGHLEVERDIIW